MKKHIAFTVVWVGAGITALMGASALDLGTAQTQAVEQSDWETCAYYDGWGDPDCVEASKDLDHKIVKQYEDGSYVTEEGYEGCLPEALCDDTL